MQERKHHGEEWKWTEGQAVSSHVTHWLAYLSVSLTPCPIQDQMQLSLRGTVLLGPWEPLADSGGARGLMH